MLVTDIIRDSSAIVVGVSNVFRIHSKNLLIISDLFISIIPKNNN